MRSACAVQSCRPSGAEAEDALARRHHPSRDVGTSTSATAPARRLRRARCTPQRARRPRCPARRCARRLRRRQFPTAPARARAGRRRSAASTAPRRPATTGWRRRRAGSGRRRRARAWRTNDSAATAPHAAAWRSSRRRSGEGGARGSAGGVWRWSGRRATRRVGQRVRRVSKTRTRSNTVDTANARWVRGTFTLIARVYEVFPLTCPIYRTVKHFHRPSAAPWLAGQQTARYPVLACVTGRALFQRCGLPL